MISRKHGIALFLFFFLSGFSSLVYQIVWLRLACGQFGVITPVLSVVLSVFMLGLGLGSYYGGKYVQPLSHYLGISPLRLYAITEALIGVSTFAVPYMFKTGARVLLHSGAADSASYLMASALIILVALLPWCILMGATFPVMIAFVRQASHDAADSFSFLYAGNILGATIGVCASSYVLIELFGFRATGMIAAALNFLIALSGFLLSRNAPPLATADTKPAALPPLRRRIEAILFITGFISMAMEVVWTRSFVFVVQTTIYGFAGILVTYLSATALGLCLYRYHRGTKRVVSSDMLLVALCFSGLLPPALNDPRINQSITLTLLSIVPFCAVLGYLTPRLVDDYAKGHAAASGRAYAINIAGCVLGPLFGAYVLLPHMTVHSALLLLIVPPALMAVPAMQPLTLRRTTTLAVFTSLFLLAGFASKDREDPAFYGDHHEIRRDYVASVIAAGEGRKKQLFVNGRNITSLSPVAKVMAHLPLALRKDAQSGLVICFGMGTTFRAMHSWGIDTIAVDISPSVFNSFGFFHADAEEITHNPKAHLVVDDGRRYLMRSNRMFDVITIDPPPPLGASLSGLLYSKEFYEVAKAHLAPRGILMQWVIEGDPKTVAATAHALQETFPYVRLYVSIANWGYHFLASASPMDDMTADEFIARMPPAAVRDMMEWTPDATPSGLAQYILARRMPVADLMPQQYQRFIQTDDHPYNEYTLLHDWGFIR